MASLCGDDDLAGSLQETALDDVGSDGGIPGQPGAQCGEQGLGHDGEHDVEVDVQVSCQKRAPQRGTRG